MDKKRFSEQIAEAVQQLGVEEAASCMARSLIYLAHTAENDFEFNCDQGQVSIERTVIPETAKH